MYSPSTGRFATLDPFYGDLEDPQSFHKYGYVHEDPINGVDPTGMFFNAVGSLVSSSVRTVVNNRHVGAALLVYDRASSLMDAARIISQFVLTGAVNGGLLAGLLVSVVPFGKILSKARLAGNKLLGISDDLADAYRGMREAGLAGKQLSRSVGDLGAISVAKTMGFEPTDFTIRYHGIDGIMRKGDELILIEAKGGASGALSMTAGNVEQLSQTWILRKIERLKQLDLGDYGKQLEDAIAAGKLHIMKVHTKIDAAGNVFDPVFEVKTFSTVGINSF